MPHFYLTIDVDAGKLVELREQINGSSRPRRRASAAVAEDAKPFKVSVNDLLLKAVAGALARVPECNAQFTEEAILIHSRIDVSVAVAVPEGLVTPVVRNADRKSVVAIAREVRELAARARNKKLKPEEMSDGTFSVSNLGMFGIDEFAAVINPPEGAILAIGQVREVPVVENGALAIGQAAVDDPLLRSPGDRRRRGRFVPRRAACARRAADARPHRLNGPSPCVPRSSCS